MVIFHSYVSLPEGKCFYCLSRSSGVAMTIVDLIRGNLPENMGVEPMEDGKDQPVPTSCHSKIPEKHTYGWLKMHTVPMKDLSLGQLQLWQHIPWQLWPASTALPFAWSNGSNDSNVRSPGVWKTTCFDEAYPAVRQLGGQRSRTCPVWKIDPS